MLYNRPGLLLLVLLFAAALLGAALLIGASEYYHGLTSRLVGGVILASACTALAASARRWAGYVCAACAIAGFKAILALIFGVTVSSGHLITNRPLVLQILIMLVLLTLLTYRFTVRLPRSRLDVVSLAVTVVAIALAMLEEPNFWPLRTAALLLAVSWFTERIKHKRRTHHLPIH